MTKTYKFVISFAGTVAIIFGYWCIKNEKRRNKMAMAEGIAVKVNEKKLEDVTAAREGSAVVTISLTAAEKKELTNRFSGMSNDELEFIVNLIPVDICLNRIHREIEKAKEFENKVKSAMASLE